MTTKVHETGSAHNKYFTNANQKKQNKTNKPNYDTLWILTSEEWITNYFSFIFVSQNDLMKLHNTAGIGSDNEKKMERVLTY